MASTIIEKVKPLFAGWRAGLARCTGATALVALINILFFSIATPNLKDFDRKMARTLPGTVGGALFEGSCEKAKHFSVWLHLAINILSSVLLTSGNYTQQVLTAPTRKEVDKQHAKHSWMDIGILSYWNLRRISKRRVLAWAILAISSVPIHLLYNSVVYLETSAYEYDLKAVRANETSTISNDFERLEMDECVSGYARQFVTSRSDLFLVFPPDSNFNFSAWYEVTPTNEPKPAGPDGWMCRAMPKSCDDAGLKAQSDDWKMSVWPVNNFAAPDEPISIKYCLSKPVEESCRLAMSVPLMAIVLGFNLLKLAGVGLTWIFLDKQPLLNLGDGVASFLDCPDTTTAGGHLLYIGPGRSSKWNLTSTPWKAQRRRWAYFISPCIYAITMVCAVAVIVATSFLLKDGIDQITGTAEAAPSFADLWDRGFGSIDLDCLVRFSSKSPIKTSLLSNTPQLIVSIIYTTVNGMWTAMMVGNEWNGYGLHRKGLRTTKPVGQQRNSYWLSLPWKYGLPLIAACTLLHWLISQSIFLVRLVGLDGDEVSSITTSPGYSPVAIIFAIICGATIMIATVGLSLVPCKTAVPQNGTCSAVLSAACHPPEGDENAALERVKWGVVFGRLTEERDGEDQDGKERCCVTSWRVEPPIEGRLY